MAVAALRELRLQSLKRVYRLDAAELCSALQNAAKRRVHNREVWDALLYRAAALRGQFGPNDLALTIDALARIRYKDDAVLDYMLQEVRSKARRFAVRDVALLLNGLAKFGFRDELLLRSLLPTLLRRITEKSKWEDLSLLALSYARLSDPSQALVFDRIIASLVPRMDRIDDGHALSLLAIAFTRTAAGREDDVESAGDSKPFAEDLLQPLFLPTQVPAEVEISNRAFVEVLLEQCERHIFAFKGSDVLHLCLALANLVRTGNEDAIAPRLIPRLCKRLEVLYYDLVPGQFVRFLELFPLLPEVEARCGPRMLDELVYRARELMPKSCLPMLRASLRLKHARGQSVAAWRLTRQDASLGGPAVLSATDSGEVAEMLVQVALPHRTDSGADEPAAAGDARDSDVLLWEAREALLVLLQGFRQRNLEPKPEILAGLLHNAALLSVRDMCWFQLCQRLMVPSAAHPKRASHSPAPVPVEGIEEVLSEADLAKATLALARLSLPQLVDGASLFTRAAAMVRQPSSAISVLEAASIFSLTERRPQDLAPAALAPLVRVVSEGRREAACDAEAAPDLPRLFPFTRLPQAMAQDLQADWCEAVATAAAMSAAARTRRPWFQEVVLQELASWGEEVDLQTDVVVGPICVPFALSFVGLDEHLRRRPLVPAAEEEEEDAPDPDAPSERSEARPLGLRARRLARRRDKAAGLPQGLRADAPLEPLTDVPSSDLPGSAKPRSHLLVELLRYEDYYHASPALEQRMKGPLVVAEREAEIRLLRRLGWHVICVPEFRWNLGEDGDHEAASEANRRLIFELVADAAGPE